jgi:hypothetical protein
LDTHLETFEILKLADWPVDVINEKLLSQQPNPMMPLGSSFANKLLPIGPSLIRLSASTDGKI